MSQNKVTVDEVCNISMGHCWSSSSNKVNWLCLIINCWWAAIGGCWSSLFHVSISSFRVVFLDGSNPHFWNFYSFLFLLMLLGWVLCGWPLWVNMCTSGHDWHVSLHSQVGSSGRSVPMKVWVWAIHMSHSCSLILSHPVSHFPWCKLFCTHMESCRFCL